MSIPLQRIGQRWRRERRSTMEGKDELLGKSVRKESALSRLRSRFTQPRQSQGWRNVLQRCLPG